MQLIFNVYFFTLNYCVLQQALKIVANSFSKQNYNTSIIYNIQLLFDI